jgi:CheY-like chemotaxis protein
MAHAIEQAVGHVFDDTEVSAQMAELFPAHLAHTRALFAMPNAGQESLDALARRLSDDAGESPAGLGAGTTASVARMDVEPQHGGGVLVVDDSEITRALIRGQLEAEGFTVTTAASGVEALQLIAQQLPALVLLDVLMPEMDGFELCQRIRERTAARSLPIVFLSSACSLEERLRGLTVGGDDFIRKPYEVEELSGRVRAHLQRVAFLGGIAAQQRG